MTKTPALLVGLAVGDSLGMFAEMYPHDHPELLWWDGRYKDASPSHKWNHGLKAGQWTDDTSMALALAESIVQSGGYDATVTLQKYVQLYKTNPRGMGGTIRKALAESLKCYEETGEMRAFPVSGPEVRGNGVVMRIAPLSVAADSFAGLAEAVKMECGLTHDGPDTLRSALWMVESIKMTSASKESRELDRTVVPVASLVNTRLTTDMLTVKRAQSCFAMTNSFAAAVQMAVRLGGDTDTVAACTGAIAGAYYGMEGIPKEYLEGLEDVERIIDLQTKLYAVRPAQTPCP